MDEHTWTHPNQVKDTSRLIAKRSFGHLWYLLKKAFEKDEFATWKGRVRGLGVVNLDLLHTTT